MGVPDVVQRTQAMTPLWGTGTTQVGGTSSSKTSQREKTNGSSASRSTKHGRPAAPPSASIVSSYASASRRSDGQFDAFAVARSALAEMQDESNSTTRDSTGTGCADREEDGLSDLLFCRPDRRPVPSMRRGIEDDEYVNDDDYDYED